ncbi:MAG TPA: D-alanyl-D-alanine carboxypeptidase/D-alanyl-D-alanine-endopeptidase [Candidatus Acidoferrales bacterium]|nr:D-alanyl-D-alanine carboxypeptidase/D-alanyl-D-alanine-endopeptidase [Candidatus Acidoferrales bacterium]
MLALFALLLPPPLFEASTLRGAHVSAYVISAQTGKVLYARDPDAAMMPASTLKLVVGSSALDELGTSFAFTTSLATDGTTLYLEGSGDPLLREGDFDDAARALDALQLTTFTTLAGDAGSPLAGYPDGWELDDLAYYYAAPPSPLSIDENTVRIAVHPAAPGAQPSLSFTPATDAVKVVNDATTGPADSQDTTNVQVALNDPDTLVLTGSVPADDADDAIDAAILDPARVALDLIAQTLTRGGIHFAATATLTAAPPNARVLWTHHSPPLPDLLRAMWLPSNNLLAESLLDALAPTREEALERERAWLQSIGIDPATTTLADGSGLSAYDRITARDLVTILAHDWNGPNRAVVMRALPISGDRGTLKNKFTAPPLAGAVIAKTGTVNHTRTLAGFLQTPHGTLIFALMINDWMDRGPKATADLRAFQSTFLESFFE